MTAARIQPLFNALTSGSLFRQYRLLEQIGVGGEGVVWSALDEKQGQIHAIKFRDAPDAVEETGDQQLEKLIGLQHAHILPILEYGFEAPLAFTVSPYLPGGTLLQKLRMAPLSVEEIMRYGTEIASALDYLHNHGIIHRDLKSQNILLDLRNNCYLTDFGLARMVSTSTVAFHTGHGTPPYASPEQIQSRALSPKSDLYSFGILLYEMFTGQLPWNGKRQLSLEQLNSNQELPDPRDFNENLPFVLTDILRRVTAADPDLRPSSATEIMRLMRRIFGVPEDAQPVRKDMDGWKVRDEDVEELLKRAFVQWNSTSATYNLGLTKFAMIHMRRGKLKMQMYNRFLLSQALTYGYNDDQWWQALRDPRERLIISGSLLRKHNEGLTARIVTHLTGDPTITALPAGVPDGIAGSLLETALKTDNPFLRREIFDGLRALTRPKSAWGEPSALDPEQSARLGVFALEDSEAGDTAAILIGHLRSASAVQVLLNHSNEARKIPALLLVQRAAGSLPGFVPRDVRFRLSAEWIVQRLIQEPVSLISAYVLAFLGAALGVGMQVYLTYNLPDFMDTARITTSLVQGLIVGTVFGLGVFVIRVMTDRFQSAAALPRVLFATLAGLLGLNIAMLSFHVLFLNTPPRGFLITAGCLLIAFAFALGGLLRWRILRMMLSSAAVFAAILGTWWIHRQVSTSLMELTPLFQYSYAWSLAQVAFTALTVALPIGVLGNLVNLSILDV